MTRTQCGTEAEAFLAEPQAALPCIPFQRCNQSYACHLKQPAGVYFSVFWYGDPRRCYVVAPGVSGRRASECSSSLAATSLCSGASHESVGVPTHNVRRPVHESGMTDV